MAKLIMATAVNPIPAVKISKPVQNQGVLSCRGTNIEKNITARPNTAALRMNGVFCLIDLDVGKRKNLVENALPNIITIEIVISA